MNDALMPLALLLLALLAVIYGTSVYNRLVRLRNAFRASYAQIDVQLKRRYDLIPNLVQTAKAYLQHEAKTLERVIRARNQAAEAADKAAADPGAPEAMDLLVAAEGLLKDGLRGMQVVVEQYPELQADQTMARLHEELLSTENRVAFARQVFNDEVMDYNTLRESVPANLVAGLFGFKEAALLASIDSPEERQAPKVSFD